MSSYPATVLPGQSPPFAVVTAQDHTAWIIIAAALGTAIVLISSSIRIFIKIRSESLWAPDDMFLTISTVRIYGLQETLRELKLWLQGLSIAQTSLLLAATSSGLGKSIELISSDEQERPQQVSMIDALLN